MKESQRSKEILTAGHRSYLARYCESSGFFPTSTFVSVSSSKPKVVASGGKKRPARSDHSSLGLRVLAHGCLPAAAQ